MYQDSAGTPTVPETLSITNDGPRIVRTTFWQTAMARAGRCYLSTHAGACRLLVPQHHRGLVWEMRTAREVVVSRGPLTLPGLHLPDALELLFDDGTEWPFSLHLPPGHTDRMPLDTESAQAWTCTVWHHGGNTHCEMVLERPAHYRRVRRLPDLRPWAPEHARVGA